MISPTTYTVSLNPNKEDTTGDSKVISPQLIWSIPIHSPSTLTPYSRYSALALEVSIIKVGPTGKMVGFGTLVGLFLKKVLYLAVFPVSPTLMFDTTKVHFGPENLNFCDFLPKYS